MVAAPAANVEPSAPTGMTEAEVEKLSQADAIEIYDERPDKPFDRDTEVRLTGEQLAARGATDLGTALSLLPDVTVRDAGRGGTNLDVRGARKGSVSIFIDGVLVSDPYYGTFDVSSIPITDIVQIRVATGPQSPIDGGGGNGAVIEVLTRDAIGQQLVIIRFTGDTLPTAGATATARVSLSPHWGLRVSGSGDASFHAFALPAGANPNDGQSHYGTGSLRLEYRDGKTRVAVDGFIDERHYMSPPSEDVVTDQILLVDREATKRGSIKADTQVGDWQVQAEGWMYHLYRKSLDFTNEIVSVPTEAAAEDLTAFRSGAMALATRPLGKEWRIAASAWLDYDQADVKDLAGDETNASTTIMELAADAQYEHKTIRLDGAVGLALPFIYMGPNPWPEGKLDAKWRPHYGSFELDAIIGRKGRIPSLRERFDPMTGNPGLGPEMIDDFELRAIEQVTDRLRLEFAPFYKHQTGTVRSSTNPADNGRLINLGVLQLAGFDLLGRIQVERRVELGGAWDYIYATSDVDPTDPLDRLPHHKIEGWVQVTPDPHISLIARVMYFGANMDSGVELPGSTTVELTATAPISKKYLAVLKVEDLLNAAPEIRAGYYTVGRIISIMLQGTWD
ncbi:MAG TPA: TonB-dependent receptor plug domain-containing protein [Kofleriaceae bacterium]